ncbi:hypothetical protein [Pseudoalteromonas luteoviolacea]|uniref:Uncharacterized protein n=1 Tax=Pseudoalteromonas luteoviolacea NCIMB 1942 TaxID=1365253 RepID=A0A162AJF9_9GAMM|nr:hypothetical protein [Pseudoalteromonas luteoviolacea]KZN50995.1 hypothetical protein N482_06175 [Pseudoalteromonas luteoviolacea NCIMB 1942]
MWTERFPEFPNLNVTSLENNFVHSQLEQSQMERIQYLLDVSNTDAQDFICYATHVDFPIWSSTYRIYFEHQ